MKADKQRHRELADMLRTGRGTPALKTEYELLDARLRATRTPTRQKVNSIWDLPITKRMWEADAAEGRL